MNKNTIGQRLKNLRKDRKISLETLAKQTDLNLDFLVSLEEDEQYPSLGPLLKISRFLGERLGTLLDDNISIDPLIVRPKERQRQMTTHRGLQGETRFFSLGRGKNDRHMEPFFIELFPNNEDKKLSNHEGEEFIVVLSGVVQLVYGSDTFTLNPGDSIYYNSCVPHNLSSIGNEKAEIYAILYFPE